MRRLFHKLRSQAIEPFNGLFKNVLSGAHSACERLATLAAASVGAIVIYIVLLYQYEPHLPLARDQALVEGGMNYDYNGPRKLTLHS